MKKSYEKPETTIISEICDVLTASNELQKMEFTFGDLSGLE